MLVSFWGAGIVSALIIVIGKVRELISISISISSYIRGKICVPFVFQKMSHSLTFFSNFTYIYVDYVNIWKIKSLKMLYIIRCVLQTIIVTN